MTLMWPYAETPHTYIRLILCYNARAPNSDSTTIIVAPVGIRSWTSQPGPWLDDTAVPWCPDQRNSLIPYGSYQRLFFLALWFLLSGWMAVLLWPVLLSNLTNLHLIAQAQANSARFLAGEREPCAESVSLPEITALPRLAVGALAHLDCATTEQYLTQRASRDRADLEVFWQGYILARHGQHQQAIEIWQQHAAGISHYFVSLAKYNQTQSEFNTAVKLCTTATAIEPQGAHAWQCLGESAFYARSWEKAAQAFTTKLTLQPDDPTTLFWLGRTYRFAGKYEQAENWLKQAIDAANDSGPVAAFAWYELGHAFLAQNREGDALQAFQQVQKRDPEFLYIDRVQAELARLEERQ